MKLKEYEAADKTCEYCKFFDVYDKKNPGVGYCRVHSPVLRGEEDVVGVWPEVYKPDWCGEWEK